MLTGLDLAALTPPALLGLAVLLLLLGRIVPRSTYMDLMKERDDWKKAHQDSEAARVELNETVNELLEHARATNQVLRSLPEPKADRQ